MKNFLKENEHSVSDIINIVSQPDRREYCRQIAMFRLAKIKSGIREGWGFVKNLSTSGMMLHIYADFVLADTVVVTLHEEEELTGIVRWREGESVGIQFDEAINIAEILKKLSSNKQGHMSRLPRVQITHPVNLYLESRLVKAEIFDISPSGMCIRTDQIYKAGIGVKLSVPRLPDIFGTVRWQAYDRIGIAFIERLSIHKLMAWLSTYYTAPASENFDIPLSGEDTAVSETKSTVPKQETFHIRGHDELGREMPIAIMHSAELALSYAKATSRYFDRVTVRDGNGTELPITKLVKLVSKEKQAEK